MENEERKPKYQVGDQVRVVNYGSLIWISKNQTPEELKMYENMLKNIYHEDDKVWWVDMGKDLIGKVGTVGTVSVTQGVPAYSLDGIPEKASWYQEGQLEFVTGRRGGKSKKEII